MADAMVTARMARGKKEAGLEILSSLGTTASGAINDLFDYVITHRRLPFGEDGKRSFTAEELADAFAFIDGIARIEPADFVMHDDDALKRQRLIDRGLACAEDFR